MKKIKVCQFSTLKEKEPTRALIENVDLVLVRYGDTVSILYGRCLHRGALMADGHDDFGKFNPEDLTTFKHDLHLLTGIAYSGAIKE